MEADGAAEAQNKCDPAWPCFGYRAPAKLPQPGPSIILRGPCELAVERT